MLYEREGEGKKREGRRGEKEGEREGRTFCPFAAPAMPQLPCQYRLFLGGVDFMFLLDVFHLAFRHSSLFRVTSAAGDLRAGPPVYLLNGRFALTLPASHLAPSRVELWARVRWRVGVKLELLAEHSGAGKGRSCAFLTLPLQSCSASPSRYTGGR